MSDTRRPPTASPALPAAVELSGIIAPDLTQYVQDKIAVVLAHTGRAAMYAHVRIVRHTDPARERPVTARASVRLAGADVHVHAEGTTAREATDLLLERLDHRIARISRTRRGDRCAPAPVPSSAATPATPIAAVLEDPA